MTDPLKRKLVTATVYYYGDEPVLTAETEEAFDEAVRESNEESNIIDLCLDDWRPIFNKHYWLRRIAHKILYTKA